MNTSRSIISRIRPHLKWVNQVRYMKPTIKIAKDKFIVTMEVRDFFKDEISVKAKQDYVLIEGRQERKCKNGFVIRQFARKFKLPEGCTPSRMETRLSDNGILTFTAHRYAFEIPSPCDRKLPIICSNTADPNDMGDGSRNCCVRQNPYCFPQNPCCMPQNPCYTPQYPCYAPGYSITQENPSDAQNDSCEVNIKVNETKDFCAPSKPDDNTPKPDDKKP